MKTNPTPLLRARIQELGLYGASRRWQVGYTSLHRLLHGRGGLSLSTAAAIARAEGRRVEDLFQISQT